MRFPSLSKVVFAALLVGASLTLSNCTRIEPGFVGIKINLAGDDRGVDRHTLVTGWVMFNPITTRVLEWPTYNQTVEWTHDIINGDATNEEIIFNSIDGTRLSAPVAITYRLHPDSVPNFYQKFRTDDMTMFTDGFLRNEVRDAFNAVGSQYGVEQINGPKKSEVLDGVRGKCIDRLTQFGIVIEQLSFTKDIGMPENIRAALNLKEQANQDAMTAQNRVAQAEAEARMLVAQADGQAQQKIISAKADAEANRLLASSLSPQLLAWKNMEIQLRATEKWDGGLPTYMGGETPVPFLNVGK